MKILPWQFILRIFHKVKNFLIKLKNLLIKVENLLNKVENISIKVENLSIHDQLDVTYIFEFSDGDNLGDNN